MDSLEKEDISEKYKVEMCIRDSKRASCCVEHTDKNIVRR